MRLVVWRKGKITKIPRVLITFIKCELTPGNPSGDLDVASTTIFFIHFKTSFLHPFPRSNALNMAVSALETDVYQVVSFLGTRWSPAPWTSLIWSAENARRVSGRGHPFLPTGTEDGYVGTTSTFISYFPLMFKVIAGPWVRDERWTLSEMKTWDN